MSPAVCLLAFYTFAGIPSVRPLQSFDTIEHCRATSGTTDAGLPSPQHIQRGNDTIILFCAEGAKCKDKE